MLRLERQQGSCGCPPRRLWLARVRAGRARAPPPPDMKVVDMVRSALPSDTLPVPPAEPQGEALLCTEK